RIVTEIGARDPPASERIVHGECVLPHGFIDVARNIGGQDVPGAAGGVLGLVVVKRQPLGWDDVDYVGGAITDNGAGQLASRNEALDHDLIVDRGHARDGLRRLVSTFAYDDHADARALANGFCDVRRLHCMRARSLSAVHDPMIANGHAERGNDALRLRLVHGERGCADAGVGIRDAHDLQETLYASVLAPTAMECVEAGVRSDLFQLPGDVPVHVDLRYTIAGRLERGSAGIARAEAHLPFGGPSAHHDGDVLILVACTLCTHGLYAPALNVPARLHPHTSSRAEGPGST